jgi:phosphatidylinositol glycan class B
VRLLCLFWFLPYLHARTSSENLAGSYFMLAVAAVELLPGIAGFSCAGILFGFSFLCRFQMGIAIAAWVGWLAWRKRPSRRDWLSLGLAFGGVMALGLVLDRVGYGNWVVAPWRYFDQNLVAGEALKHGQQPFYYYVVEFFKTTPPLGAVLLAGMLGGILTRPGHVLSLSVLAFFVAHSMLAHKEPRFIFPIAAALPILLVFALERAGNRIPRLAGRIGVGLLLFVNCGALLILTLKPSLAQIGFYAAVYRHDPPIRTLHHGELDPYAPFKVALNYYRPDGLNESSYPSFEAFRRQLSSSEDSWLFYENFELTGDAAALNPVCALEYTTFPSWLNHLTFLPGPRKFANRWSLYKCRARPR